MGIRWQTYPRSSTPSDVAKSIAASFLDVADQIETPTNQPKNSNSVLARVRPGLEARGFEVETPGAQGTRLEVPVLFGFQGKPDKRFRVDAWHREDKAVLEVEGGGAIDAHRFHKDLLEGCMLADVDVLCIALMNEYRPARFAEARASQRDFESAVTFLESLYASRLQLPMRTVMVLGY
jgi:hypothetical protein